MDKKTLQTSILEKTYQPEKWLDVMKEYFSAKKFHIKPLPVSLPSKDIAESAVELGSFYTADERLIAIYEVKLTEKALIERNRVGLRNLFKSVIRYDLDAALIVYVQQDKWRFSYVSEIRTAEGKKETEPKRYTYLFGEGESCRTAADRFDKLKGKPIYLNDLFDAFSVEKLNKGFFKTYKEFYEKFWKYLAPSWYVSSRNIPSWSAYANEGSPLCLLCLSKRILQHPAQGRARVGRYSFTCIPAIKTC